jgi:hypothetical protein
VAVRLPEEFFDATYSEPVGKSETEAFQVHVELPGLMLFHDIVEDAARIFAGRPVLMGGAAILEHKDAEAAACAAQFICKRVQNDLQVTIGVGLALGSVTLQWNGIPIGDTVDISKALQERARGGGIYANQEFVRALHDSSTLDFDTASAEGSPNKGEILRVAFNQDKRLDTIRNWKAETPPRHWPVHLRFALIGGPPDFHVHSMEWARVAFSLADRVLAIERRTRKDAFGLITDVDYAYGAGGPIRTVVREMVGSAPPKPTQYRKKSTPPKRGRWYIRKTVPSGPKEYPMSVYIYSCERVMPQHFEEACKALSWAALCKQLPPPLVILPDGVGGRAFGRAHPGAEQATIQRDGKPSLDMILPEPDLTEVISETGKSIGPELFMSAVEFLEARHHAHLTVWDVIGDEVLMESAAESSMGSE